MLIARAAFVAAVVCAGALAPVHAAAPLTLDAAFRRVIDTHPDLAALRAEQQALAARIDIAALEPALELGASLENALGSGTVAGLDGAEFTLSLAGVLERGGQRAGRIAVAERELEQLEPSVAGRRLDLLAEVARRYLDALAAEQFEQILRAEQQQREALAAAVASRRRAGAESESAALAARAAQLRVEGELDLALRAAAHARATLAALWGSADGDFALTGADLGRLPRLQALDELLERLADSPEMQRFAHAERLREARLQLARSAASADLQWQFGLRRLQAERDWAMVAGVSIPLGGAGRAEPGIRAAQAELAALAFERESEQRALALTLHQAHRAFDLAAAQVQHLDARLLPALEAALEAAERSYRSGASSPLEWSQLQGELIGARRTRIEAALSAHRALIELQRLTGRSFAFDADRSEGDPS
jgi:cobalt-zinc-cadmium efflux system outer membrane protein